MKKLFSFLIAGAVAIAAQAVTLTVTVPTGTKCCYVAGDFQGWSPGAAPRMQQTADNTFTLSLPDVTDAALAKGYKYICGPDWKYVEKDANGGEISNRTSCANPDVVAKWASIYEFNPNIRDTEITVNGYKRKVQILVPEGYDGGTARYPVIYYVGVNQRYHDAGDDSYAGDNLFAANSWNAANTLPSFPAYTSRPAIIVCTYSFPAENMPYPTAEFMGSGASDAYLNSFISNVIGYVDSNYRTLTGANNTAIMGADLGGMLALYAALSHPDRFGRCLAMSPLLWINHDDMQTLASSYTGSGKFVMTYGTAEPSVISSNLIDIPGATKVAINNGLHNDASWGNALPSLYSFIAGSSDAPSIISVSPMAAPRRAADISTNTYHFYCSNSSASTLGLSGSTTFSYLPEYVTSGGSKVKAQVAVRDIDASFKSTFYWNVKRNDESGYMMSSAKTVGFSSKKTATSWLRIVIREDETIENVAASSIGFTVQGSGITKTQMDITTGHKVGATVEFPGADKSFTIHYGSVNSQSDMGTITSSYSVSASCTVAYIEYDFATGAVTITEKSWGDVIGTVRIREFSASSACYYSPGNCVVTIDLDETDAYQASLSVSKDYGTPQEVALTADGTNRWTAELKGYAAGFYTLSLNLKRGTAQKDNVDRICVTVLPATSTTYNTVIKENPYKDIDWATIGRYKANFHTHTTQSNDAKFRTDEVVDRYHNAGYKILALTDHDANPYPWEHFNLFNAQAQARVAADLGMLAIPGVELSKDMTNSWHESTGGEFNHHNDFFTGRKGQEFMSLRESYAYTNSLGGMQIINHPGQYWNLNTEYTPGEKNSPEWHAENFRLYPSLVGFEVYNQGNRRPNDRILWDQVLDINVPYTTGSNSDTRPVWGYSCDDTHNPADFFRNYQFMLMPELTVDALKDAMRNGHTVFSYEPGGTGNDLAPHIISITDDGTVLTIESDDATDIRWISGSDRSGGPSTRKSTVVGIGKSFRYSDFRRGYVRAALNNEYGETLTQPFILAENGNLVGIGAVDTDSPSSISISGLVGEIEVKGTDECTVYNTLGVMMYRGATGTITMPRGIYIVKAADTTAKVAVR